jgi:hypothetical protein
MRRDAHDVPAVVKNTNDHRETDRLRCNVDDLS